MDRINAEKRQNRVNLWNLFVIAISFLTVMACAGTGIYMIDLMPAPDVYDEGAADPFSDANPIENIPFRGILYATDREPAGEEHKERYYLNRRGHVLRLGVGQIALGQGTMTWEEARRISLLKNRTEKYPLQVVKIEEMGILDRSLGIFTEPGLSPADPRRAAKEFAALINEKLAVSRHKDIYIYVHGYKVVFENPLLVAAELWHFLGYEGVFIAYAWPSTPSRWAYASDLETASYSARYLRQLLTYLADETNAERIHIIGYSAGTRVVIGALAGLMLEYKNEDKSVITQKLRMGHVILVGSDHDRHIFGGYLEDGLLKVPQTLTVYMSESDKALGISNWFFARQRLGQIWTERKMTPVVEDYLRRTENLRVIDVTEAERSNTGNGHAYFRKSPWVSSDILMTLLYDLAPEDRGLVLYRDLPIWVFPNDYSQRLRNSLGRLNPDLKKGIHGK